MRDWSSDVCSSDLDLLARGIDADKIIGSPNGVDLDLFGGPPPRDDALAETLGLAAGDVVIGYIGSFYDYEGIDDLIAAMPALVATQPKARLLLVGGGPMEAALKTQAAASPAAAQIHFVGRVPHSQVERYYSLIDRSEEHTSELKSLMRISYAVFC